MNAKKILSIVFLLGTIAVHSQVVNLTTPSGSVNFDNELYVNNLNQEWHINVGNNNVLKIDWGTDTEYYSDYLSIYNLDDSGNRTLLASYSGLDGGTVITTIPNGKAIVTFVTDGSDCYGDGYSGIYFNYESITANSNMYFTGDTYISGKMAIGTTNVSDKLNVGGNISATGRIHSIGTISGSSFESKDLKVSKNAIIMGTLGLGALALNNKLLVNGNVSVGAFNSKKPLGYGDKLFFRGLAASGNDEMAICRYNAELDKSQLRVLLGDDNQGDDKFVIGNYFSQDTTVWRPFFSVVNNNRVGINTDNPQSTLDVNGQLKAIDLWTTNRIWIPGINFQITDQFDPVSIYPHSTETNRTDLRISLGDDNQGDDRILFGNTYWEDQVWHSWVSIVNNGRIGINTENPQHALDVNGVIRAKEVRIEQTGWADFVFAKNYHLPTLESVKAHIDEHNTLPGIPSEKEVKTQGVSLSEMNVKLLQKIEELTLYIINQDIRIKELEKKVSSK